MLTCGAAVVNHNRTPLEKVIEVEREGHVEKKRLKMGSIGVRLPERPDVQLWLVVKYPKVGDSLCERDNAVPRAFGARVRGRG